MPLYEFECTKCGEHVDILGVKFEDRDKRRRHACGGTLKRQMSPPIQGKAAYQMQAVVTDRSGNTQTVAGHFAKDATRKRR